MIHIKEATMPGPQVIHMPSAVLQLQTRTTDMLSIAASLLDFNPMKLYLVCRVMFLNHNLSLGLMTSSKIPPQSLNNNKAIVKVSAHRTSDPVQRDTTN